MEVERVTHYCVEKSFVMSHPFPLIILSGCVLFDKALSTWPTSKSIEYGGFLDFDHSKARK
jgi:hypothetical protein